MLLLLYIAFAASGMAGLVYELAWSRYLALFVGHNAYAQVLVIAVYLGGMAVGALAAASFSRRIARPLLWYAAAEGALAVAGLAFHAVFVATKGASYDALFPNLPAGATLIVVRWAIAIALILPQAVLLGTTFPLMSAGVLRGFPANSGRTLGALYFTNTIGGAAGILLGGFVLIAWLGLPGTLIFASGLNLLAAGIATGAGTLASTRSSAPAVVSVPGTGSDSVNVRPLRILLTVAFLTAVASFGYEIGWIRMLSLVMGSATHSFEIMLSAFLFGIALGAWLIRRHADSAPEPLRLLGWIQWTMGLAAIATLPLYLLSFDAMAWLLERLPRAGAGYALFGAARYLIAAAVMVPATLLAGMTLPLITNTLLRAGAGERAIGWVYGWNTLGSVAGVGLAGLVALPVLGLNVSRARLRFRARERP